MRQRSVRTLMSIEPHPQPGVKVRKDLNSYRLKQDGQDYQDGQDEGAIARACPSPAPQPLDRLRSSRTLSSCFLRIL